MGKVEAGQWQGYRLPLSQILLFILAMLLGKRRELGRDVKATLAAARLRFQVPGRENIPAEGPFVLVANHYERPGLKVWWGGMVIGNAVYERRRRHGGLRWLMTSEWYNFRLGGLLPVPVWFLRWLFRRIANVYGLVIVPRSPQRAVGRAAAMRSIMEVLQTQKRPIGLYPEGVGKDSLIEAMPGTGTFLHSLSKRSFPILPAGVFEEEGALTVRFGPAFLIELPQEAGRRERDVLAREQVMARIGCLLPEEMWGAYRAEIEKLLAESGRSA